MGLRFDLDFHGLTLEGVYARISGVTTSDGFDRIRGERFFRCVVEATVFSADRERTIPYSVREEFRLTSAELAEVGDTAGWYRLLKQRLNNARDDKSAVEARFPDINEDRSPVNETSSEPEADDFTQAETVKPDDETSEEGEAAASEIYDPETEVAEPLTIDELVRSGTMLTEDEFAMRVGVLAGRIEQYAQQRIAAKYDANVRADMLRLIQNYISKGALGIHTTPDEDAAYARANEQNTWITAQEAHARRLREQLPSLSLEMLRAYRLEEAGWP